MNCNKDNSDVRNSQEIIVDTPYGKLHINDLGHAQDHVAMKTRELFAFLTLVSGGGQEEFAGLRDDLQNCLLWMAAQSAGQIDDIMGQVHFVKSQVQK